MSLTVCTGWSPTGYLEYGRRFAESFAKHWPADVNLVVYGEQPVALPRGEFRTLSSIPMCAEFIERHRHTPSYNGRAPVPRWKRKEIVSGYSYRFDAVKFSRQGFIPLDALQYCADDLLCWLDGDVVTFRDIPRGFIEGLLPARHDIAYLGREPKHPDLAFQLYRTDSLAARNVLNAFANLYVTDAVFNLPEWHSAYAWKHCMERFGGTRVHNLTPGGRGHVWFQSPLRVYMDHLKGDRKGRGRSKERA